MDNKLYNLAKRMDDLAASVIHYDYQDSLEIGETKEDSINKNLDSLNNKDNIQVTIEFWEGFDLEDFNSEDIIIISEILEELKQLITVKEEQTL